MPQPTGRDLYIDKMLSDISIAYLNEPSAYIADVVFPAVLVDQQSGKIAKYEKDDWFRDEAELRAPLSESAGGGYRIATPATFFCDEWAFHKDISDEDLSNQEDPFDLEDDATQFVTERLRIRRERIWAEKYFKKTIWGKDLIGQTDAPSVDEFLVWDDANSTPIEDISDAKSIIKQSTGIMPNTLVVAEKVHMSLKNHADIVDRFKYTQAGIITEQLLARVFEIDRYVVAAAIYAKNLEGVTADMQYILTKYDALLVYSAPRPSLRRPTGGYTIRWKRPTIAGREGARLEATIRRFRLEKEGGVRIDGSVYEDLKLVSKDVGVYFENCIADGRTITS